MKDIKGLSPKELEGLLTSLGEPKYRARELFQAIYQQGVLDFNAITTFPIKLREQLSKSFFIYTFEKVSEIYSEDGTKKFLYKLQDGSLIESVFMKNVNKFGKTRITACLSTQVGCPLACTFCATGKMGFTRNLEKGEIVEQLLQLDRYEHVNNVVFMGMGEPLLNYENLKKSIEIISDENGRNLGKRKISISTSGIIDKIYRLTDEIQTVKIAISLHSAIQNKRDILMPKLKEFTLENLKKSLKYYTEKTGNTVTLEYILIKGINDSEKDINALVEFANGIKFIKVNIIHYNNIEGAGYSASDKELWFEKQLLNKGLRATLRVSKGEKIRAACGQLSTRKNMKSKPTP